MAVEQIYAANVTNLLRMKHLKIKRRVSSSRQVSNRRPPKEGQNKNGVGGIYEESRYINKNQMYVYLFNYVSVVPKCHYVRVWGRQGALLSGF